MRKISMVVLLVIVTNSIFAQGLMKKDSTYKKMDYFHFEAAWLGWVNKPDSVKLKALSHTFSFYFTYPMQLGKSKINFIPGIGLNIDNAYTNSIAKEDSAKTQIVLHPITSGVSYKISKETYTYLMIPLMFNYNAGADSKSWKASLGLRFNYMIQDHTKYKGNDEVTGESEKTKNINILKPYSDRYRLDGAFTLGYDWFYVMATYSFTPYFASGKGPQMMPLTIGIGAVGF